MKKKIALNERIFIAGSKGMVGRATHLKLIERGYGKKSRGGELLTPNRNELDLTNYTAVENWFKLNRPTVVILAAAKVGGIFANNNMPSAFILENLKIQTNLIEIAFKYKVKRFLFLGSSCIYPKFAQQPIEEDYLLKGELEPTNEWYAIAKIAGIKLCQALRKEHNFDTISLMPTNLYGPNDNYHEKNSHVMAALIKKFCDAENNNEKYVICWGSGNPMREFMHVEDLADAIIFCLENWCPDDQNAPKDSHGKPLYFLNVGSGKDISIKDLALLIANQTKFKGEIIWDKKMPDGTPKKLLNVDKIKTLGWQTKIDLKNGIRSTINEYRRLINDN